MSCIPPSWFARQVRIYPLRYAPVKERSKPDLYYCNRVVTKAGIILLRAGKDFEFNENLLLEYERWDIFTSSLRTAARRGSLRLFEEYFRKLKECMGVRRRSYPLVHSYIIDLLAEYRRYDLVEALVDYEVEAELKYLDILGAVTNSSQ